MSKYIMGSYVWHLVSTKTGNSQLTIPTECGGGILYTMLQTNNVATSPIPNAPICVHCASGKVIPQR
jgi:hypothetical protein